MFCMPSGIPEPTVIVRIQLERLSIADLFDDQPWRQRIIFAQRQQVKSHAGRLIIAYPASSFQMTSQVCRLRRWAKQPCRRDVAILEMSRYLLDFCIYIGGCERCAHNAIAEFKGKAGDKPLLLWFIVELRYQRPPPEDSQFLHVRFHRGNQCWYRKV